ncbi:hypothetical protein ACQ856_18175 [Mycolicibacterium psychrotolerans]|uniref:hypothetical protein n=1 Tax=Mycolicibacterium psychrotolerans TaxID=216929 RepID=UPI003D6741BD
MTTRHHPHTPAMTAAADAVHARGRGIFDALVADYRSHREQCVTDACPQAAEETAVASIAYELFHGMTDCGHWDCLERAVRRLAEAAAYAAVRTANSLPLDRTGEL